MVKKILDPRENKNLPGGESNPGLSRDRRGYSPLYYRGLRSKCVEAEIYTLLIAYDHTTLNTPVLV